MDMSNIFLIGDVHLGLGYPNNAEKWFKVHREYFETFLIPLLKKFVKPGDIIIQLGDLFDNRNILPINILNYGIDIAEEISKIAPLHFIIGNHDLWSKNTSGINSLRPIRYMPNVYIYDKTTKIEHDGVKILLMPYIESKREQIKHLEENKDCKYLFTHSDLNGARMHLTSAANKNLDKINPIEFSKFEKVYSGHIHIRQELKNIVFVGSIFQQDRNDMSDQKGISILNVESGECEFIPNNVSPIFRKINILSEKDIETLDSLTDTKDYIDISISNKLLIKNRKLRRKLEFLLEKGNFSSVDYVDDLVDETKEKDEEINESSTETDLKKISITLDYEEYIKDYISKKEYTSDTFKKGVIDEFNDIIKIYNENYKL
jgi:calcineurin-like phosphoesterase family protein